MVFRKIKKFLSENPKEVKRDNENTVKFIESGYTINKNIEVNLTYLKEILGRNYDVVFREYKIFNTGQTRIFLSFANSLVNLDRINQYIVQPLVLKLEKENYDKSALSSDIFNVVNHKILNIADTKETQSMDSVIYAILSGNTALFIDGYDKVLIMNTQGYEKRGIEESTTERAIRGSHEGFTEDILVNSSLIRRRLKNPNFILEEFTLGKQTHTTICIGYIEGIVNPKIVEEVKVRIKRIDKDSILESGYIEQLILDNPFTIFPSVGNSENPDTVAGKLLEGRVAIFCDGTPFVLTVPLLFIENLQSREDYYSLPFLVSLIRLLRGVCFIIAMTAPAIYVALTTFHYEMIPTVLIINMAASREGIPFPAAMEIIIIFTTFEILREATLRMPKTIGTSISILGTLVIGEAAVRAGIMSNPAIIVMAITAIAGYVCTPLMTINVILRLCFTLLATLLGIYGMMIGFFLLLGHMCSLRSFGVAYLTPIAPTIWSDLKDTLIRAPLWLMKSRPNIANETNLKRQATKLKPGPDNSSKRGKDS